MLLKTFFSTFLMIFMAELGDKTQFASLAAATGSRFPVIVFLGASSALIASTLIAVVLGSLMSEVLPVKYLKLVSALIFFIFGAVSLYEFFQPEEELVQTETVQEPDKINPFLMIAVCQAEEEESRFFYQLAEQSGDKYLKELFLQIAVQEDQHLKNIRKMDSENEEKRNMEEIQQPYIPVCSIHEDSQEILRKAVRYEESIRDFYLMLSKKAVIPAFKSQLKTLSDEENSHVAQLRQCLKSRQDQDNRNS